MGLGHGLLVLVSLLVSPQQGGAQEASRPAPAAPVPAIAARALEPVTVDGLDADPVWRGVPPTGGFRQFDPELDAPPTHPTEFRVAYDEADLYVFVRAYDPHPDSVLRALTRRDVRGPSDQIGVLIDSYHDRRTGFGFWVNPDGVYGTVGERQVGQSLVKSYFWINPDGSKGMLDGSTDDREGLRATAIAARH